MARYWRGVLEANDGDAQRLKEVVVKDSEIVGVLAALVLTITVAGLTIVDAKLSKSSWFRSIYVILIFLSFISSLISLMTASRMVLSINKLPPKDVLAAIEALQRWGVTNSYNWFQASLYLLLFAVDTSVFLLYDRVCFALCSAIALVPCAMMCWLNRSHMQVIFPLIRMPSGSDSDWLDA